MIMWDCLRLVAGPGAQSAEDFEWFMQNFSRSYRETGSGTCAEFCEYYCTRVDPRYLLSFRCHLIP